MSTIGVPHYRRGYAVIFGVCFLAFMMNFTTHLLRELGLIGPEAGNWFLLTTDRGLPEIFGYIFLAIAVGLLIRLTARTKSTIYAFWTIFTIYLIADDSLKLHETFGRYFASDLPEKMYGLRGQDIGELLYAAIVGSVCLALLLSSYAFSKWRDRGLSLWLLIPTGSFVICAIGFDILHSLTWVAWNARRGTGFVVSLFEDGGELFSMGLFLIFCIAITKVRDIRRAGSRATDSPEFALLNSGRGVRGDPL